MSMTTAAIDPGATNQARATAGRRAVRIAALLAGAIVVFAATMAVREKALPNEKATSNPSTVAVAMPHSAQIERAWGVRIKSVTLLASTGVVDVRYTVLDADKANRLHSDGRTGLPSLRTKDQGTIEPYSVMFHFHSKAQENAGQGYDIIYGNAHGALHAGSLVTIVMADGLELGDVPVTE
jgi:hypothetical protein